MIGRALVKRLLRRGLDVTLMIRSGAAERRKSVLEDLDTAEFLKFFIGRMAPKRTTFFGISSGGYAAKPSRTPSNATMSKAPSNCCRRFTRRASMERCIT